MSKIRVLSVDDSALMRQIMTEIINSHSDMEMVATAPDPLVARDLIKKFNPDVLTLDVEMPRMDGLDFLEKLMRLRPMPVVMVSSLTGKGSEVTLRALELGAIDFVTKPQLGIREGMLAYSEMIAEKVRTAAKASLAAHKPLSAPTTLKAGPLLSSEKLIAIGASTGGTEAIRHVLQPLPLSSPALLITQHMPPGFTRSLPTDLISFARSELKKPKMESASCRDMPISRRAIGIWSWRVVAQIIKSKFTMARRLIAIGHRLMCCSILWPNRRGVMRLG